MKHKSRPVYIPLHHSLSAYIIKLSSILWFPPKGKSTAAAVTPKKKVATPPTWRETISPLHLELHHLSAHVYSPTYCATQLRSTSFLHSFFPFPCLIRPMHAKATTPESCRIVVLRLICRRIFSSLSIECECPAKVKMKKK